MLMDYKKLIEQKLQHIKKYKRHTNFHIFIEDELYMSFPDAFQRDRHFNTRKFEKILGDRKAYFCEGSSEKKSTIDYADFTEDSQTTAKKPNGSRPESDADLSGDAEEKTKNSPRS